MASWTKPIPQHLFMRVSAEVGGFKFISSKDFFLPCEHFHLQTSPLCSFFSLKPKLFAAVVHESFFSGWLQTHLLPRFSLLCNMLPTKSSLSRRGDFGDLCRVGRRKARALCSIEEFRRPKGNTIFPGKKVRAMYNLTCSIWLLKTSRIGNQSHRS